MADAEELDDCRRGLLKPGLSETPVLGSTGVKEHVARAERGEVSLEALRRYAADLERLSASTLAEGTRIPVNFWNVRSKAMETAGRSESPDGGDARSAGVSCLHGAAEPLFPRLATSARGRRQPPERRKARQHDLARRRPLSGRRSISCGRRRRTSAALVRADRTCARIGIKPDQQAILLWQQLVSGSNRQIPYCIATPTPTVSGRASMSSKCARHHVGRDIAVDDVWGLSGFAPQYLGDAGNTNQIEHAAISAVAQMVLGLPVVALNLVRSWSGFCARAPTPQARPTSASTVRSPAPFAHFSAWKTRRRPAPVWKKALGE